MSLSGIKLPRAVIADLYKNALVGEPGAASAARSNEMTPAEEIAQEDAGDTPPPAISKKPVSSGATGQTPAVSSTPASPEAPPAATAAGSATPGYRFLGKNEKHICIVVHFEGEAFLPDNHLQFLTKMLEACRLNLGDVAIVNHATKPVEMDSLRPLLRPQQVILFGPEPEKVGLPMNFPPFKEQAFAGCTYLHAPGLHQLNQATEEGKLLKSKLWVSLKKLYNI